MKVKLLASAEESGRGWLLPEREYVVLSVEPSKGYDGGIAYRISSEQSETPALFDSSNFSIVDPSIPSAWIVVKMGGLPVALMPAPWAESGFWESFFDADPKAEAIYERIKTEIMEHAGVSP